MEQKPTEKTYRAQIPMSQLAEMTLPQAQALVALRSLQKEIYETAVAKGWWDKYRKFPLLRVLVQENPNNILAKDEIEEIERALERNKGEALALMHSEISEALENLRASETPDDKIPEFKGVEAELADVIIRILDFAEHFHYDVIGATFAKAEMNKGRPVMHGGKQF